MLQILNRILLLVLEIYIYIYIYISKVSIPKSLRWNEITFPADWTLENENHTLQIQNPAQNPDLDLVVEVIPPTFR